MGQDFLQSLSAAKKFTLQSVEVPEFLYAKQLFLRCPRSSANEHGKYCIPSIIPDRMLLQFTNNPDSRNLDTDWKWRFFETLEH